MADNPEVTKPAAAATAAADAVDEEAHETMDLQMEYKKRLELVGNMESIEREFAELKERFFKEKLLSLKKEIEQIKHGTHAMYSTVVTELEETRDSKIRTAERWRAYQLQNIENIFLAEKKQAEDNFKSEKRQLRERMINYIIDKKKKIGEEKQLMNLDPLDAPMATRQLRRRGFNAQASITVGSSNANSSVLASNGNSVTFGTNGTGQFNLPLKRKFNPPHISYSLREGEIDDDLRDLRMPKPFQQPQLVR